MQPTTARVSDDLRPIRRARTLRRLGLAILFVVVLCGAVGLLGVRTGSVSASHLGTELTVRFPSVARPGLAAPFSIEVRRPLQGPIQVRTSAAYLEIFDQIALRPEPIRSTMSPDDVTWTFAAPADDTLVVTLDARIEPGVQWSRGGSTAVLVDGRRVASVEYTTWVMP